MPSNWNSVRLDRLISFAISFMSRLKLSCAEAFGVAYICSDIRSAHKCIHTNRSMWILKKIRKGGSDGRLGISAYLWLLKIWHDCTSKPACLLARLPSKTKGGGSRWLWRRRRRHLFRVSSRPVRSGLLLKRSRGQLNSFFKVQYLTKITFKRPLYSLSLLKLWLKSHLPNFARKVMPSTSSSYFMYRAVTEAF